MYYVVNLNNLILFIIVSFSFFLFMIFIWLPSLTVLSHFFKYHPCQPKDPSLPFNSNKIFLRENGTNRVWLTFDESSKQLFCTVCLAFASESNSFTKGVSDWKHVHQRIKEHESRIVHSRSSESCFLKTQNKW